MMSKVSKTAPWNHDKPRLDAHHLYRGYPAEVKSLFNYVMSRGNSPPLAERHKFLVFGGARSGSSLLVNFLNQQKNIDCLGEILRCRLLVPHAHRDRLLSMTSAPICGFKLLTYQVVQVLGYQPQDGYLESLCDEGYKIIYISRDNKLRMAVSNMYARLEGQFHNRAGHERNHDRRHIFPPTEVVQWIEGAERRKEEESIFLNNIDYLSVSYEQDLESPSTQQETLQRVCRWLGTNANAIQEQLKPVTPRLLESVIENHEEVRQHLMKCGYSRYLEGS